MQQLFIYSLIQMRTNKNTLQKIRNLKIPRLRNIDNQDLKIDDIVSYFSWGQS
jgi:hypothetical protein